MATLYLNKEKYDISAAYYRGSPLKGLYLKNEFWGFEDLVYYYGWLNSDGGELGDDILDAEEIVIEDIISQESGDFDGVNRTIKWPKPSTSIGPIAYYAFPKENLNLEENEIKILETVGGNKVDRTNSWLVKEIEIDETPYVLVYKKEINYGAINMEFKLNSSKSIPTPAFTSSYNADTNSLKINLVKNYKPEYLTIIEDFEDGIEGDAGTMTGSNGTYTYKFSGTLTPGEHTLKLLDGVVIFKAAEGNGYYSEGTSASEEATLTFTVAAAAENVVAEFGLSDLSKQSGNYYLDFAPIKNVINEKFGGNEDDYYDSLESGNEDIFELHFLGSDANPTDILIPWADLDGTENAQPAIAEKIVASDNTYSLMGNGECNWQYVGLDRGIQITGMVFVGNNFNFKIIKK